MSDHTAASPDDLARAADDFQQISQQLEQLKNGLTGAIHKDGQVGSGQLAQQLKENYQPGEDVAVDFLKLFSQLFVEKGNLMLQAARVFNDADGDATAQAQQTGGTAQ